MSVFIRSHQKHPPNTSTRAFIESHHVNLQTKLTQKKKENEQLTKLLSGDMTQRICFMNKIINRFYLRL